MRAPLLCFALLATGCPADLQDPFDLEGDYLLAYMEEDGSGQLSVTVDSAAGELIGPAHWDDPDPHGTTTLPIEQGDLDRITAAIRAVDFPALDGADLGSVAGGPVRYFATLQTDVQYHLEWDSGSDVTEALWDLQALLHDLAMRFEG